MTLMTKSSFTELTEDQIFLIGKLGATIEEALDTVELEPGLDYGAINLTIPGPKYPNQWRVQVNMPGFASDNLVVVSDSLDGALSRCVRAINERHFS